MVFDIVSKKKLGYVKSHHPWINQDANILKSGGNMQIFLNTSTSLLKLKNNKKEKRENIKVY